jgi:hypothetical protein
VHRAEHVVQIGVLATHLTAQRVQGHPIQHRAGPSGQIDTRSGQQVPARLGARHRTFLSVA